MRRLRMLALFACLLTGVAAAPGASSAGAGRSWAQPQIRLVVSHGLMARTVASFRPNASLTQGELSVLVAELTGQPANPPADPSAPVTMAQLDARLVRALDMSDDAALFQAAAAGAGIHPPARFGTEVTARLLGLRTNHPTGQDDLERLPNDPAPRAEAAYSVAQILTLSDWQKQGVEEAATTFELPVYTPWQRRVLTTAVKFIGFPYIWGGESETPQSPYGAQVQGGFDCSGFAWRVYKLQAYTGGETLGSTLKGRTTYAMSSEVPPAKRIGIRKLQPADLLFFGSGGPRSKPADINHMGIYLGGGWFVQASSQGVSLSPLSSPWYSKRFAWARRPLAEAGLT